MIEVIMSFFCRVNVACVPSKNSQRECSALCSTRTAFVLADIVLGVLLLHVYCISNLQATAVFNHCVARIFLLSANAVPSWLLLASKWMQLRTQKSNRRCSCTIQRFVRKSVLCRLYLTKLNFWMRSYEPAFSVVTWKLMSADHRKQYILVHQNIITGRRASTPSATSPTSNLRLPSTVDAVRTSYSPITASAYARLCPNFANLIRCDLAYVLV